MDSCPGSPARRADSMSETDERKALIETRVANTHKASHMIKSNAFVGSWQLVSTRFQSADGTPADSPYGNDAHGILMYDTNGFMAAQLAHATRQPWRLKPCSRAKLSAWADRPSPLPWVATAQPYGFAWIVSRQ